MKTELLQGTLFQDFRTSDKETSLKVYVKKKKELKVQVGIFSSATLDAGRQQSNVFKSPKENLFQFKILHPHKLHSSVRIE